VVGVIATVMAMRALEARRDPFPHALMHVQQWHAEQLKGNLDANRCNATDTLPHLAALRSTADDIEHAFPELADDQRFKQAAASCARRWTTRAPTAAQLPRRGQGAEGHRRGVQGLPPGLPQLNRRGSN
jgi:hypothetical protein